MCILAGTAMFARVRLALDHVFGASLALKALRTNALETITASNRGAGATIMTRRCCAEILSFAVVSWNYKYEGKIYE